MAEYVNYEVLRQAGAATVDKPTGSVAMGMLKEASKYAKNAKAKADKIKSEYPEGINVPKVDSDIRPALVSYLEESRDEYDKAAKKVGLLPSWSPGYKKARDTINRIKDGYANVDAGLKALQANRIKAGKIEPGKGATSYELAKSSDLVNGDYATYDIQFSDQGVTYLDGQERKSISDFVSAAGSDGVGSDGQTTLYNQAVSDARNKVAWEEADQRGKIDGFIDGMNNTQLKNWMFSGPRSYGYAIALNNLGYDKYPVIETTDELAVKQQKQDEIDKIDLEIDRLKYDGNLKGEQIRDQLYDALKTTYNKNAPSAVTDGGGDSEITDVADSKGEDILTDEEKEKFESTLTDDEKFGIKTVFEGKLMEKEAIKELNIVLGRVFPGLKGLITEKNFLNPYTIGFNGKEFDLQEEGSYDKFIKEIIKYKNTDNEFNSTAEERAAKIKEKNKKTSTYNPFDPLNTFSLTKSGVGDSANFQKE